MHKTVNADGKRFLTTEQWARNINNTQNIENVFNFGRGEINIFFFILSSPSGPRAKH